MPEMIAEKLSKLRVLADEFASLRQWSIIGLLGSGGSAAVFKVNTGDDDCALKVYDPLFLLGQQGNAEKYRIELQQNLIGHDNPNLVSIFGIDYECDTCFILMECIPWKEMSEQLHDIPRKEIFPLIAQLVNAVRYLENRGLVHRDIKPENILISSDFSQLKLIDLGVIRVISESEDRVDGTDHGDHRLFIATAQYSSPEYLFRTTAPSKELWQALTFYQIGAVLHDLITRVPLFAEEVAMGNRYTVSHAVLSKRPSLETKDDVPNELKQLASHCLLKDPAKRLRFVSWDDFMPMNKSDIDILNRRIKNLQEQKIHRTTIQQENLKQTLKRRQLSQDIYNNIHNKLIGSVSGANIEVIDTNGMDYCATLRFHIPNTEWAVDLFLETDWAKSGQMSGEAEILIRAALVKSSSAVDFLSGGTSVTVITEGDLNLDIVTDTIYSIFFELLEKAISQLEVGTSGSNVNPIELFV